MMPKHVSVGNMVTHLFREVKLTSDLNCYLHTYFKLYLSVNQIWLKHLFVVCSF